MSEESDRMMVLFAGIAGSEKADENDEKSLITKKPRKEISREMKQLAVRSKNAHD